MEAVTAVQVCGLAEGLSVKPKSVPPGPDPQSAGPVPATEVYKVLEPPELPSESTKAIRN
jgi:hypothetical protein